MLSAQLPEYRLVLYCYWGRKSRKIKYAVCAAVLDCGKNTPTGLRLLLSEDKKGKTVSLKVPKCI